MSPEFAWVKWVMGIVLQVSGSSLGKISGQYQCPNQWSVPVPQFVSHSYQTIPEVSSGKIGIVPLVST